MQRRVAMRLQPGDWHRRARGWRDAQVRALKPTEMEGGRPRPCIPYPGRPLEAPQGRGGAGSPCTGSCGVGGHLRLVPTDAVRPRTGYHPPPWSPTARPLLPDPLTKLPPALAWPPAMITDPPSRALHPIPGSCLFGQVLATTRLERSPLIPAPSPGSP